MSQRGMGARIRARRLDLRLKQAGLARAVGISAPYLNLIEHDRRPIGGRLLLALARELGVPAEELSEGAGSGLVAALGQAAAAPLAGGGAAPAGDAAELAARFPDWAGLVVGQHARIGGLEAALETLSDRLTHDPRLAAALHEVLSTVTAIRSAAAILTEEADLPRDWLERFHRNIDADARRLALVARDLVGYLEGEGGGAAAPAGAGAPQEVFAAWLAAGEEALPEAAEARALALDWQALCRADAEALPLPGPGPHDPLRLAAETGLPLPLVFRRLAAMDRDWGLVSADGAGAVLFCKPPRGFLMPRLGAACALWPLFLAQSRVMQPFSGRIEQAGRIPRRFRYWAVAEPLAGTGLSGPPVFRAHMLLAAETSGPDLGAEPVGTSCRICPRPGCAARREASVLPS